MIWRARWKGLDGPAEGIVMGHVGYGSDLKFVVVDAKGRVSQPHAYSCTLEPAMEKDVRRAHAARIAQTALDLED